MNSTGRKGFGTLKRIVGSRVQLSKIGKSQKILKRKTGESEREREGGRLSLELSVL